MKLAWHSQPEFDFADYNVRVGIRFSARLTLTMSVKLAWTLKFDLFHRLSAAQVRVRNGLGLVIT